MWKKQSNRPRFNKRREDCLGWLCHCQISIFIFAILRICALSVHLSHWNCNFLPCQKICLAVQNCNALAMFGCILEQCILYTGIVLRRSAKQNGCSGNLMPFFFFEKTHDQCCTNSSCSLQKNKSSVVRRGPRTLPSSNTWIRPAVLEPQCNATDKRHASVVGCFFFHLQVREMVQAYT